jgi:predicted enzyme related to lactoylglutathione lyase
MGRPVIQFQILSKNPDRSTEFYTSLFDWKTDDNNPLGYRTLSTLSERGINGGIWPAPPEGHSFVQLFVEVDDVTAYLDRATALGGTVVMPKQALPGGEQMGVFTDPEGIPVVVFKPA